MRALFQTMKQHLMAGEDLVLATVVASSGSTPRGAGSRMLVGKDGILSGTIGGGNVEYRSILMSQEMIAKKASAEHFFALNRTDIENLGMICGGDVNVFFQFLSHEDPALSAISERAELLFETRRDFWLINDLTTTSGLSLFSRPEGLYGTAVVPEEILLTLSSAPKRQKSGSFDFFTEQIGTSGTVYVFGGGHVSQKLVPALAAVNFSCVVLDDRPEFTNPVLFPDADRTILCDFSRINDFITVTDSDYCCVMTRGHAYDTIVQAQLLRSPALYIGVIGSRSKKAGVFKRLIEEFGIPEEELSRIVSPIGLSIKAETPAEIAVSITGQMIQVRAERKARIQ